MNVSMIIESCRKEIPYGLRDLTALIAFSMTDEERRAVSFDSIQVPISRILVLARGSIGPKINQSNLSRGVVELVAQAREMDHWLLQYEPHLGRKERDKVIATATSYQGTAGLLKDLDASAARVGLIRSAIALRTHFDAISDGASS